MMIKIRLVSASLAIAAALALNYPSVAAKEFNDTQISAYGTDDVRLSSLDSGQHAVITLAENSANSRDANGNLVAETTSTCFAGDGYTPNWGGAYPTTYDMSQQYYPMAGRRYPSVTTAYYQYTCALSRGNVQGDRLHGGVSSYTAP